jgi:hypothetical protein
MLGVSAVAASGQALAQAQAQADPLKSEACATALQQLDAARRDKAANTEALRQAASQACLGASAPARPLSRGTQPAAAAELVRVPAARPSPVPAPLAPPAQTRGPVAVDRPLAVTQCDAGGCWDPQGRRLDRVGDQLIGPRGPCLPQAGGFACP